MLANVKDTENGTIDASIVKNSNRVLIVDDDPGIHTLLGLILKPLHLDVKYAINGYKGLEMILAYQPGLIILDLAMPGLDGFEVLNRLSEDHSMSDIPVMVFSAYIGTLESEDYEWPEQVVEVLQKTSVRASELRDLVSQRLQVT